MDRPTTPPDGALRGSRHDPREAFVLPSRRPALDHCRATLRPGIGLGPILVTGDAGVGKTWFWRRLQSEAPPSCRWIGVDLTPADDPGDFYRLIAHEIGLAESSVDRPSRVGLVDFLADRLADGERLALVVEEAHNLSIAIWEEVRVLANRLDRPGGFSGMMLVGQTALARKVATRPFAPIDARLALKVHLGPIDADEAGELLGRLLPDREWSLEEVEALHRDGAGNPRRMLRRAGWVVASPIAAGPRPVGPWSLAASGEAGPLAARLPAPTPTPSVAPLAGPSRPPIQVDENMIEVGWSPESSIIPRGAEPGLAGSAGHPSSAASGEEAVRDHHVALLAWREWAENQARPGLAIAGPGGLPPASEPLDDPDLEEEEETEDDAPIAPRVDRPRVRAEGEQAFAPFGQLFSRMAQAREPGP